MSTYYSKEQQDSILAVVGSRIKTRTDPNTVATAIEALPNKNFLTDAEKTKLSSLEGSKFLGTFTSASLIPTVDAKAGSYAHVDAGVGSDIELYIYDVDDSKFVKSGSTLAGETSSSIKTKYEANADTNAFTDSHKVKLDGLVEATDITGATAALDGALA